MYAVTSNPLVRRTRATFRSAELGFLGVVVYTRVHTPRFCGLPRSAGAFSFLTTSRRPWRISWLIVGIRAAVRLPKKVRRQNGKSRHGTRLGQAQTGGFDPKSGRGGQRGRPALFSPARPYSSSSGNAPAATKGLGAPAGSGGGGGGSKPAGGSISISEYR